ncbi:DsbA family protein [Alkalicoccobacillus porphyridii]|uniref:DsbA family protein n=1 Tax=Alkalicoccobacillus porphyridii TaxID=2597270 RepID=A0A554A1V8_9BACI|nr:thioredoxin domain-containing protein [Alkalicoccobacillus porphyridii]TSB47680.1 DsbA family protein [Alkalicoccobacillus porphyridii]
MSQLITMKRLVFITIAVFVVAVSAFFIVENLMSPDVEGVTYAEAPDSEGQPLKGDPSAPVVITEFGDYKCPSCKGWDESIMPQLDSDYIQPGEVQIIYINTLFHGEESGLAALASESVWENHPDAFWEFHSKLFQEQPQVQSHDEPWVTPEAMIDVAHAMDADIDLEVLATDMLEQTYIDLVHKDMELVENYEVTQTPTIMVGNVKLDNPFDYEQLKLAIEQQLEEN